jgi:ribulose 1,5-bisphosphate synthetase/thiazole synthase
LTAKQWNTVIVGGEHNGLTRAFYLVKAGQNVLLLEPTNKLAKDQASTFTTFTTLDISDSAAAEPRINKSLA